MPPEILIIADDVTGALDSAVAFAARGMRTVAALSPEALGAAMDAGADAVAVATNSREISETAARAEVAKLRAIAAGFPGVLFKKIDSRLKGHIAAEIQALSIHEGRPVLACPSIPRLGRIVRDGAVRGMGVETPIPVSSTIGGHAWVLDATRQEDIVEALPDDLRVPLFVGAAGLGEALAMRLRANVQPCAPVALRAPALLAIGSRDPVTLAQIAALDGIPVIAAPNGVVPAVEVHDTSIVEMTPGAEEVPAQRAGAAFAEGVADLLARSEVPTLFASGGETAETILHAIGVNLLEVRGELLVGVPLSTSLDGPRRIEIITKSGGFGPPDTLVKVVKLIDEAPDRNPTESGK